MKSMKFIMGIVAMFAMTCNAAWHWGGTNAGVGDFEDPSSWGENSVPGVVDFLVVKNFASSPKNWVVDFNSNVTNLKVELVASTNGYSTTFDLNGYAWELTEDIHMYAGAGGDIVFTNGTIKTPYFNFLTKESVGQNAYYSQNTNLVLELKDVDCETVDAVFASTRAIFEGGSLIVSNKMSIGSPSYGMGTVILDKGAVCDVQGTLSVGDTVGATGELVNVNGQFEQTGADNTFYIGKDGTGSLTLEGGSFYVHQTANIGNGSKGVGSLTVSGGLNRFGTATAKLFVAGASGKATILATGGTNYVQGLSFGYSSDAYGEMTLSDGVWNISSYSWIGYWGKGVITQTGGTLNSGGTFCIGRGTGIGIVTVAGGTLIVNGEIRLGGNTGSTGQLTLTGDGTLKAGWIGEQSSGASSELVCDGGTLQVGTGGNFIRLIDNLLLTTNGMVLDTMGLDVSIESALEDASGQAGSFVKQGAGSVTLAAGRTATGPVSVLQGTLVSSNDLAVAASGTVSKIDDTLTLTADKRLIMSSGAAIAGVGTVTRVTLQDNAVIARDKADSATIPLIINDGIADDQVTIALTGYTLNDLKTALPLISAPTEFIDLSKVTVTLDGVGNAFLTARYAEVDGQQVLLIKYSIGTVILVR
jgi:autotransporter-associated beta strand protein